MTKTKILLATDGSKPSLTATKKAIEEAKEKNGVVYAVTIKEMAPMTPLEKMQEDIAEEKYLQVRSRGADVAEKYGEKEGVEVIKKEVESGPVLAAILDYAEEIEPDLIVLGNTGRSGLERLALGSVAEGVVRNTKYPVLVTKIMDDEYLKDIIEIAKQMPAPEIPEEEIKKLDLSLEDLEIKKQLGLASATLLAFLIPYFGYGAMTSFLGKLSVTEVLPGLNVAIIWVFLLFPAGWITSLLFNQYAKKYDRPRSESK
ncbi:MAG: Nucleotide-binding protein UspA family [Candidatus Methanohalarchaeum thermophilum]|uniref:Nucleotide-binding protein UspA family n=1 Tax=Methanohalarchaeum thermophilum TaxID=1903181 RepID=A0A1Q6DW62_METT1|nr:MAG: Nucleotide-binding protein UspA family [Candidatus Methanohalarchaeum thermophilum]